MKCGFEKKEKPLAICCYLISNVTKTMQKKLLQKANLNWVFLNFKNTNFDLTKEDCPRRHIDLDEERLNEHDMTKIDTNDWLKNWLVIRRRL